MASRGVNKVALVSSYESGMSIPEVSNLSGLSRSAVRYHLKKAGVLRSVTEGVRNASKRGRLGSGFRGKKREFTESHCESISKAKIAHAEKHAKGLSNRSSGYSEFTRGENKGRSLHRVIMEKHIGRKLGRNEHVHHIDGNKRNNDISNLELMSASNHAAHHAKENHKLRRRNKNGTWS